MANKSNQFFSPEDHISIDAEHTLEQLSGKFQSVKDGLPELIKNSKDHYARLNVKKSQDRQIIIIISEDGENLGVLDFAGAALADFKGWKTWSSRTANRKEMSSDIEAGYGNGGKSFMVRGCNKLSSMCGYRDCKINKWGFLNDEPKLKYHAGIFKKSGKELKNYVEQDHQLVLNSELSVYGIEISSLPKEAQEVFEKRRSFTLVSLMRVRDWQKLHRPGRLKIFSSLPDNIMQHAQASLTLDTCNVWVMKGSKLIYPEKLKVSDLPSFEGLEDLEPIPIPSKLIDPETSEEIELRFKVPENNNLILKTSRQNLRLSDRHKARNVIRIKNERNVVANWLMADLVSLTSSAFIYGTLVCDLIEEESIAGSDRMNLADNALIRSLKHWVSNQCVEIAKRIHKIQLSKNSDEDKNAVSETLQKLRNLMREFLRRDITEGDAGDDFEGGRTRRSGAIRKKGMNIDEIVLEPQRNSLLLPLGTTVPLVIKCYETRGEEKFLVSCDSLVPCADKSDLEWVGNNMIRGTKEGVVRLFFETLDGKVQSNTLNIKILNIEEIKVGEQERVLKQGERYPLKITSFGEEGQEFTNLIYETYVDEIEMGSINRDGIFTAGGLSGYATVRIKYGTKENQVKTLRVQIGEEKISGSGGDKGNDIPLILLCSRESPNSEDRLAESRTHPGGEDHPTIIDNEPLWKGIIWINSDSKESRKARSRGEGGFMKIGSPTFQQFLTLKCFEVLKRLKMEDDVGGDSFNMDEFRNGIANAEMETASFLDKAYILVKELVGGEEDEE
ncbi:MAG: hypothetical protein KKA81_16225 [Bacteroidetes bacterium]|nr:hypothetical protein [Bacteroidota bacterium]